jgi:hypothetical protein
MSNNTDVKNKPKTQADKTRPNIADPKGIPEVFDSSKYDSMEEMKESAGRKEERHSNTNTDSSDTIKHSDTSPPNPEQKAATLRGQKKNKNSF